MQGNTVMEIGRALLKCESGIAATHNWRLAVLMYSQLEILPKYFSSDFIYSYFVPMAFFRILHAVSYTCTRCVRQIVTIILSLFIFRGQYPYVSPQELCSFFFYVTIRNLCKR